MKKELNYKLLIILLVIVTGCKKAYTPSIIDAPNSYLIVEGVINSGGDSTIIKLSRTVKISGNVKANKVNNCTVTVEDEQGGSYTLQAKGNGLYVSASVPINATKKYRLHIVTSDNKQYASDYVTVKQTPPIDNVTIDSVKNNLDDEKHIQVYADTHDPANNTRYYRWDYSETWKFRSFYDSNYIVDKRTIRERTTTERIYTCFGNDTSTNIIIGSSAKLTQDVISKMPLAQIPAHSEKLSIRYSILVKQYALTKDEYQFWENLKKNTEQLGSIFDAQPSQIQGNIHNLKDAAEPVIGFVSITNVQTKRIFVNQNQATSNGIRLYPFPCQLDTAFTRGAGTPPRTSDEITDKLLNQSNSFSVPVNIILGERGSVLGYYYSSISCVDCTVRGKRLPPPFWVE